MKPINLMAASAEVRAQWSPRVAQEECWIMLVETVSTRHTGDVVTPLTRSIAQQPSGINISDNIS